MKDSPLYTRRTRSLIAQLRKDGAKSAATTTEPTIPADATHVLLLGIFCNYAPESKAVSALDKLMAAMVDLNDLRVTPVSEIVEIVGVGLPSCRPAAEEVSQVLASIFNRIHDLDLGFLRGLGKKSAAAFINALDGLSGHAAAFFKQRHLGMHVIPLDVNMFAFLHKGEFITEKTEIAEAQRFCASLVKERDGLSFYSLFKRYAATHSPPKSKQKVTTKARAKGAVARSAKEPTAKKHTTKDTAARKAVSKKARPRKTGAKKAASKTSTTKNRPAQRAKKKATGSANR